MSFLSNVLPIWNNATSSRIEGQINQVDLKVPQPSFIALEDSKHAKKEVKLPSIPLDISDSLTQRPKNVESRSLSRNLMRMAEPDDNCWFCAGQTCQATSRDAPSLTERAHDNTRRRPQPKMRHTNTGRDILDNSNSSRNANHQDVRFSRSQKFAQVGSSQESPHQLQIESESSTSKGISSKRNKLGQEPVTKSCQYCGLKFGSQSVAIHEKRCNRQQHSRRPFDPQNTHVENTYSGGGGGGGGEFSQKLATIVTVGLGPGLEKTTVYARGPPRPQTRTIVSSTLHASGFGLPLTADHTSEEITFQDSSSSVLCEQCNQVVAVDRISVHRRLCKPKAILFNTGNITFSTAHDLLRTEESAPKKEQMVLRTHQQCPTKQCYICGREFGSRSIDIHEPQCMKKWQIENRKLPIGERKSIPKKPESKPTILSAANSIKTPSTNVYEGDTTEESVQRCFMKCYSEFEHDLVPCKKCGRTFAPDRHRQHEQHCNAKPLYGKKLTINTHSRTQRT